jgi:Protein of unknown function (DUF4238)
VEAPRFVSDPRKHHYVPACYLKQWISENADRRLCEHKLIPGVGIKPRRTSPDGTGYEFDLYRVDRVPESIAQDFEKRFLHFIDTDASRALENIIINKIENWDGTLRSAWTRFILSLLFRNPEAVATIRGHIIEMWDEAIKALEVDYAERRTAGDPKTFEFFAKHQPSAAHIGAANFLAQVIDNDRVGTTVFGMNWSRIDMSESGLDLLTSDRPIVMPLGLADPQAYILLPVSPRILFAAAHRSEFPDIVRAADAAKVVGGVNEVVVQQARKFVWGTTDSQLAFVQQHFGKLPDRVILTDEQRREAIAAARGSGKELA